MAERLIFYLGSSYAPVLWKSKEEKWRMKKCKCVRYLWHFGTGEPLTYGLFHLRVNKLIWFVSMEHVNKLKSWSEVWFECTEKYFFFVGIDVFLVSSSDTNLPRPMCLSTKNADLELYLLQSICYKEFCWSVMRCWMLPVVCCFSEEILY